MATALGLDADLRPLWADRVAHLAPFPTATISDPAHRPPPGAGAGARRAITVFTAQEYPKYFPGSFNPLNVYSVWPGEMADTTPELRAVAKQTVTTMGALGSWQQGNAFPEMIPAAVRAGVEPAFILGNLTIRVNDTMAQSGVMAEGAETQGATQGVNDMLCSSFPDGVIRLFNAWPLGEGASFTTLRAKGAFLVSASLHQRVVRSPVTIASLAGGAATLLEPAGWTGGIGVRDGSGGSVAHVAGTVPHTWTWPTKAGQTYTVVSPEA